MANAAIDQVSKNMQDRQALLATAPRMVKNVATITSTPGTTSRIKLFNVGVITKLNLYVSVALTIGVATATASTKAPWNVITRLRLTDYDGTDRINISGFQLFVLNSVRWAQLYGYNNDAATAVLTNPSVPTAVGAYTGTTGLNFYLEIPLAFNVDNPVPQLQDLRGAILGQTAVGEMYLSIDWNPSFYLNGDLESVYSGSGTTTITGVSITATMWQEYLLPQAIGANGYIPIPAIDLMTVYELNGNIRSSDNLAVGTEKLINYPNVRSVIGMYANFVQAASLTFGKVNTIRMIANGNNIMKDHSETLQMLKQRLWARGDIIPGCYFNLHRDKPIETALFGNVQMGITPNTVGATPYIEVLTESFYTKGMALPGIAQAG
jgi:hypothetical protein